MSFSTEHSDKPQESSFLTERRKYLNKFRGEGSNDSQFPDFPFPGLCPYGVKDGLLFFGDERKK